MESFSAISLLKFIPELVEEIFSSNALFPQEHKNKAIMHPANRWNFMKQ
jgi:hypothetical protein